MLAEGAAQWLTNGCFHLSWREYDITRAYYRVSIDVDGKWRIAEPPQIASHDAMSGWSFSAEAAPDCRHRIRFDNNEAVVPFDKASMAVLCRRSATWR